ncbi:dipeptidyl peptidase IV N-terminal region-domain-containing protein, partial [Zopfochytrium polystomum]
MEVDEGAVEMVSIARAGLDDKVDRYRYPRPGRPNARSEPCVATFRGGGGDGGGGGAGLLRDPVVRRLRGELQVRALFPWAEYIPRIGWMPDGKSVWMQLLDRPQQRYVLIHVPLTLFTAEGESAFGRVTVLFEDTSDYWINVTDISYFFKPQNGVAEFIWSSERTGYRHLYYVVCPLESDDTPGPLAFPGRRVRQITSGPWQVVDNSIWVDEGKQLVYFIGKKDNPLENHLYVTSYATTDLAAAATEFAPAESDYPTPAASEPPDRSQLLTEPGFSHSIRMDASSRFFVATSSSVESRPRSTLFRIALHHASPAAESPRAPTVSTSVSTTATSNARTGERSPARAAAAAATSPSLQQYQQPVSLRGRKHSLQDA